MSVTHQIDAEPYDARPPDIRGQHWAPAQAAFEREPPDVAPAGFAPSHNPRIDSPRVVALQQLQPITYATSAPHLRAATT